MFYRIEGTSIKIAGTTPAYSAETAEIPSWLQSVFDRSEQWMFAADTEPVDPAAEQLPAHQSLTVLSFFDQVSAAWQRLQIPGRTSRFKAWAASAHLCRHLTGQLLPGVEALLVPEARRRQPPPQFLELPQDYVVACDAIPLEEQLARLEHLVTRPEEAVAFDRAVYAAWRTQNIDAIARRLDDQRKLYPATYGRLLDDRNAAWLPKITRLLHENESSPRSLSTLVAVDALHLCGERGLVALLTGEGCKVTRLL